jgi:hypothetical protein
MSIASFMAFKLLFIDFLFMLITTKEISKIFKIYSGFNFMYLIPTVICFYAFIIFQITQLFIPLDMFISNILLNAAIYLMFFIYMFLKHPGALFISKEDSLFLRKKLKL